MLTREKLNAKSEINRRFSPLVSGGNGKMKTERENLAERFLLGKLTEEEAVKIEEGYFAANSQFENLLIAENDLIDAYAKNELSAEDRRRFENRLLLNPRQRERVRFAKTLINYASTAAAAVPAENLASSASDSDKSSWRSIFGQIFSAKLMFSYSFAAAILIFLAGTIFWLAIKNNSPHLPQSDEMAGARQSRTEKSAPDQSPNEVSTPAASVTSENENAENKPTSAAAAANRSPKNVVNQPLPKKRGEQTENSRPVISTIILPFGATRAAGDAEPFDIPARADFINLRLKFEEGDFAAYYFVLETVEGQKILSGKIKKAINGENEKTVVAAIPAGKLKKGDYIISLKGLTTEGAYESIGDYSFTINHRR
jgi:hypothetical protein